MTGTDPMEITDLLARARSGDATARESFWHQIHGQLRDLARQALARERANHTLQATALVHEAYLRLVGPKPLPWENRAHFFGAAARAIRQILVDHARARGSAKRGGADRPLPLSEASDVAMASIDPRIDILALHEALQRLETFDPRKAQVVELRFFAGLNVREIASLLGVAIGTVAADWKIARLWLHRELADTDDPGHGP